MFRLIFSILILLSPLLASSQIVETAVLYLSRIPLTVGVVASKTVLLNWKNHLGFRSGFFIVERRSDSGEFAMLVSMKVSGNLDQYEFIDQNPLQGINHYRVKHLAQEGNALYSAVIPADFGSGNFSRFYPNPADNSLIVQSQCAVDLKIFSNSGTLTLSKLLEKGITALDVSSLEKGVYVMMMTNVHTKNSIRQILYKN